MEENVDYYIENGFYVFTEKYHLKRGFCCKSGCRHCPWSYQKDKQNNQKTSGNQLNNFDETEN